MSINSKKEPNIRGEVVQLRRVADALEEILQLVKADQEKMAIRFPEPETDELSKEWGAKDRAGHF